MQDVPHKLLRRKYPSEQTHSPRTQCELGSEQTLPGVMQGALYWPRGTTHTKPLYSSAVTRSRLCHTFRLWRFINHLLTYLLTYLLTRRLVTFCLSACAVYNYTYLLTYLLTYIHTYKATVLIRCYRFYIMSKTRSIEQIRSRVRTTAAITALSLNWCHDSVHSDFGAL